MVIEGKYSKKDLILEVSKKKSIERYRDYYEELVKDKPKYGYEQFVKWIESQLGNLAPKYFEYVLSVPVKMGVKSLTDEVQLNDVISLVKMFEDLSKKGKIKNKDIYSKEYEIRKDSDIEKILNKLKSAGQKLSKSEEKKLGAEKIYNDSKYLVIVPKNFKSSCYYGYGTKWCTTSSESHLMRETGRAVLYYVIDKDREPFNPDTGEGDDLAKVAIQHYYNGTTKMFDSKDRSLNTDEKNDMNSNFPEAMTDAIHNHWLEMKKKREEKYGDAETNAQNAIINAFTAEMPIIPTGRTFYGMETWEDNDGREYAVGNEDEFKEAQKENWEQFLDEMGLEGVSDWAREYIVNNFVDEDHFEDLLRYEVENYVEDIKNEDSDDEERWESRFDQELEEYEASDEEDLIDKVADSWSGGDAIEYYKMNYGEQAFYHSLSDGNNINVDDVVDWLVEEDGDSYIAGYEVEATEIDDQWYYVVEMD